MALQTDAIVLPSSARVNALAFTPSNIERSNYLLESKGSPKSFDAGKNIQETEQRRATSDLHLG